MPAGMAPIAGDIARRAFDVVARVQRAASLDELQSLVGGHFSSLGFDVWVGFDSISSSGKADVNVLFGSTHAAWQQHYKESGFDQHDVMIRETLKSNEPFFWSDVLQRATLTPKEQLVMHEAADFRLKEGFVAPMHNLDGSITSVLLTGEKVDVDDPDVRAAAHLLSIYFGSAGRRLVRERSIKELEPVSLSARQIECLYWVRQGKSATDIGDILGLSGHTVNDYVARACVKLGVRTRVQAVAEAALRGLLEL